MEVEENTPKAVNLLWSYFFGETQLGKPICLQLFVIKTN